MTTKKTSRPIKSKAPVKAIGRSAMRKSKGGVSLSTACAEGKHITAGVIAV